MKINLHLRFATTARGITNTLQIKSHIEMFTINLEVADALKSLCFMYMYITRLFSKIPNMLTTNSQTPYTYKTLHDANAYGTY